MRERNGDVSNRTNIKERRRGRKKKKERIKATGWIEFTTSEFQIPPLDNNQRKIEDYDCGSSKFTRLHFHFTRRRSAGDERSSTVSERKGEGEKHGSEKERILVPQNAPLFSF
jgi:hypothetical protein